MRLSRRRSPPSREPARMVTLHTDRLGGQPTVSLGEDSGLCKLADLNCPCTDESAAEPLSNAWHFVFEMSRISHASSFRNTFPGLQNPNVPCQASFESPNRYEVLSVPDEQTEAKNPNSAAITRKPVPGHLLKLGKSRKGTNPVPKIRPGKRARGWRNITAGDAVNYGVKAWNLAKHLATLINVEEKVWDVDGSGGTIITSTPAVVNLTNIAQGSDYYNRIGDSILCQEIEFRAHMVGNSATSWHALRVLIVRDKLQSGTDPSLGDVLQAGTSPMVQPYNEPKSGRFDILYDELITRSQTVGLATSGSSTTYIADVSRLPSLKRKWNQHIKYSASSGADASNWIGGLYLMAASLDATNGPSLRYTFRVRFTDN